MASAAFVSHSLAVAIFLCSSVSIRLTNKCSGSTVMFSLSVPSGQRSARRDNASACIFFFPGMCSA